MFCFYVHEILGGKPSMREKLRIEHRVKDQIENHESRHLVLLKTSFLF